MKFGGTSVGTSERILGLVEIVRERVPLRPVVVVSALSGVNRQDEPGPTLASKRTKTLRADVFAEGPLPTSGVPAKPVVWQNRR